jgi:hypothetical protein
LYGFGFSINEIFGKYGEEPNLLFHRQVNIALDCVAPIALCVLLISRSLATRWTGYIFLCVYLALQIGGGHRNIMLISILFLGYILNFARRLRIDSFLFGLVGGYFVMMLIGGLRNIGIVEFTNFEIPPNFFDPLNQELGTSYNVYRQYKEFGENFFPVNYGSTYVIDPILKFFYSFLPIEGSEGIAIRFSMLIEGVSDVANLQLGYGFSILVESLIAFGGGGFYIPVIFGCFLQVILVSKLARISKLLNISVLAPLPGININLNRIDFSTAFKMYIALSFFTYLFLFLTENRSRVALFKRRL